MYGTVRQNDRLTVQTAQHGLGVRQRERLVSLLPPNITGQLERGHKV